MAYPTTTLTLPNGPSGSVLTATSIGSTNWAVPTNNISLRPNGSVQVEGDTNINGNLTVNGQNITEILDTIQSRLGILKPCPELEAEFDELKALGDAYREAERKFKDQKKVFDILKNQDQ